MKSGQSSSSRGQSFRDFVTGGIQMVQNTVISNLQKVEDCLQRNLDDEIQMEEVKTPLNFDEDSQDEDGVDAFAMKFDKKGNGGNSPGPTKERRGSTDESVPQSPPSLSPSSAQADIEIQQQKRQNGSQKNSKQQREQEECKFEDEEEIFDPMQSLENFFNNIGKTLSKNRIILRLGAQTVVFGNLIVFLCFYYLCCLPIMTEQHPLLFTFTYSVIVTVSSLHAFYLYEKSHKIDAGTPEKISMITSQGTLSAAADPASWFSREQVLNFSNAFRNLLAYRGKGYVSLMHVQAQVGGHGNTPSYDSSQSDYEDFTAVTMGGLQCCVDCKHQPIKPLRTEHCHVCDQDTILSDGHSYFVDNCIGINNRRYYLMLLGTITLIIVMAIYPLSLLDADSKVSKSAGLRLLASTQLVSACFGSVLSFVFTLFSWCAALKGIYQVDTFRGMTIKENPRRKMERAEKLHLREQVYILFGSTDPIEIIDTFHYDRRPLPLKGLEWTFLQTEGGIASSDEEEDQQRLL